MSRINTNVTSLIAQRILGNQNKELTTSLERLSTGLAINRGADNPAGLIASEQLRSEKAQISAAIQNAERADQFANVAEGGLQEISSLLIEAQSLVSTIANDAALSEDEKEANQQQVDQIISTIDRISSTTSFNGVQLLNGGFDFATSGIDANVSDFEVNGAKLSKGQNLDVNVLVVQSAQHAGLVVSSIDANIRVGDDGENRFSFELAGIKGSREFSFASGAALTDIAGSINSFKDVTGVSAAVSNTTQLVIKSTDFGSDQFVSIRVTEGNTDIEGSGIYNLNATDENAIGTANTVFNVSDTEVRYSGQDIGATINGITARGDGVTASVNTSDLNISLTLDTAAGGAQTIGSLTAFTVTGGGATFNLGATVDIGNQERIGLPNAAARNLGDSTVGFLDDIGSGKSKSLLDSDNIGDAQKIVSAAIDQVSTTRARIGSFQSVVVGSTINSLNVALENVSAAESTIRDTDFAQETADLTRSQILVNAATSALAIANNAPTSALSLL